MVGNTNWIPIITTNGNGQYFVPPPGFTNNSPYSPTAPYGGWPPMANGGSFWQYPASTNSWNYELISNPYIPTATNTITVSIYGAPALTASGDNTIGTVTNSAVWTTSPVVSWTVTALTGVKATVFTTNLTAANLQAIGKYAYATIQVQTNGYNTWNDYLIIDQLGISGPLQ